MKGKVSAPLEFRKCICIRERPTMIALFPFQPSERLAFQAVDNLESNLEKRSKKKKKNRKREKALLTGEVHPNAIFSSVVATGS